jgi:hypothetical protein
MAAVGDERVRGAARCLAERHLARARSEPLPGAVEPAVG